MADTILPRPKAKPGNKPGYVPVNKTEWTRDMIRLLRKNYDKMTNRELANLLGLRLTVVRTKCYELGLRKLELEYWTDEQVQFLVENYRQYGDTELAELFNGLWHKEKGWSKKHIEKKRRYMKLKRTMGEKNAIRERHKGHGVYSEANKRMWQTRGVAPVGDRRMWKTTAEGRPFMAIKLKDGFVHYAPWLYEQIYGPVPPGCVVRLKDNNPENVVPGNLEAISREEHARRNAEQYHSYPIEFKRLITLNNKLKKSIQNATAKSN